MNVWQLWIAAGVICFIIEMFAPVLFFASLAAGCLWAALAAYFAFNVWVQIGVFTIISAFVIFLTRPFVANKKNQNGQTGMAKYKGEKALVIKKISEKEGTGRIKIFGEEWQAKPISHELEFEEGEFVKIVNNDSLIMYVEKI